MKSPNEISNEIPKIRVQIPLKSLMKLDHQFDGFSGGGSLQVWLGPKTDCEVSNFKEFGILFLWADIIKKQETIPKNSSSDMKIRV